MQQLPTSVVYLKTLAIGSELVSVKKGAVKSAEEFQMSELHIHELQAPVAAVVLQNPCAAVFRRAREVVSKWHCCLFAQK